MTKPYPHYYAVNDRPVKLVLLPAGEVDALVFDIASGVFVPDRSYFARVSDVSHGDVDVLTEAAFAALIAEMRGAQSQRRQAAPITWTHTGDGEFPYRTTWNDRTYTIRKNDFPAEPLYTLLVDGTTEVEDFDDWPPAWNKLATP